QLRHRARPSRSRTRVDRRNRSDHRTGSTPDRPRRHGYGRSPRSRPHRRRPFHRTSSRCRSAHPTSPTDARPTRRAARTPNSRPAMKRPLVLDVLRQILDADPGEPNRGDAVSADQLSEIVRANAPLLSAEQVDETVHRVRRSIDGFEPLTELLDDDRITDLLINGDGSVWIDRGEGIVRTDVDLSSAETVLLIERILAPLGRRVNPVDPVVDARLDDGSRVHVAVPPL